MLHTARAGQQAATVELYATLPKAGAMLTNQTFMCVRKWRRVSFFGGHKNKRIYKTNASTKQTLQNKR